PQICGEKDCLDANGECKCAGTSYQTYYAFASVASSNTSVATASYSNGVIYINAISPGTAYITATASLRQFTSTSATMTVTVNVIPQAESKPSTPSTGESESSGGGSSGSSSSKENSTSGSSSSSSSSSKGNSTSGSSSSKGNSTSSSSSSKGSSSSSGNKSTKDESSESVKVQSVKEKETTKKEISSKEKADENKTVESDRGKITFVQIPDGKTGKEELESILGKKEYVDFQKKDKSETILYAWEFLGTELEAARDINLNIEISDEPFEGCEYGSSADSIYLKRMEEEALPGKASTFIRVTEWFDGEEILNLYTYQDGEIKLVGEDLEVENGYVTCAMYGEENCYILTTEEWTAEKETEETLTEELAVEEETVEVEAEEVQEDTNQTRSIAVGAAALLLLGGYVWFLRKKDTK
ncbi:MAG: hypothetical protein J5983_05870, partial [Ruminococcus sp.]|nr:hypothetical protein [Ruminococcus sp.]